MSRPKLLRRLEHVEALRLAGHLKGSLAEFESLSVAAARELGESDRLALQIKANHASVLRKLGELEPARISYERVFAVLCASKSSKCDFSLTVRHNLAEIAMAEGRAQDAIEMFKEVVAAKRAILPRGAPSIGASVRHLRELAPRFDGDAWRSYDSARPYHPYHHHANPRFGRLDSRLLDFKKGVESAIDAEVHDLLPVLRELGTDRTALLVMIPGHEAASTNAGCPMARLVCRLGVALARRPEIDALRRITTISKLSSGGDRSEVVHFESISAQRTVVEGREVLLIDDVVTTGSSMWACRKILAEAGALRVAAVAIAHTER